MTVGALVNESGLSRRHITNLRGGSSGTKIETAKTIARALEKLTGKRVRVGDIFDLKLGSVSEERAP